MSLSVRNGMYTDVDTISEIHSLCWREVYSFMPQDVHAARSKTFRKEQWDRWFSTQPKGEFLIVLTFRGSVVGFALSKPNTDDEISARGEMHAAYVLPEHRGGISGPVLMKTMAEEMRRLDQWPACIWAFRDNPHRRFYTALGWNAVVFRDRVIAGHKIPEVGYASPRYSDLSRRLDRMLASCVQRQTRSPSRPTFHRSLLTS